MRYLHEFSVQRGYPCQICEYTINQHLPDILDEIYRQSPDILMLSCYIWNIEMMLDLAEEYRRICPDVTIIAGGPEVSYQSQQILEENPALDGILRGEGNSPFGIPTIPCKRTPGSRRYPLWCGGMNPAPSTQTRKHSCLTWHCFLSLIQIWSPCPTRFFTLNLSAAVRSGAVTVSPRLPEGFATCRFRWYSSGCKSF